ncbi:MAG: hypothetical protein UV73_C0005G0028 [Candidatus Gottesmanbacteria bacterium GW2011_GWA2_43_14]|uniref:Uncharacterized protein n=1 Tax=Candidatus Gottesmanbacteria bacterium GW2011_GWA2_43_14 TaxID=1618443 RepID=A0A0G1FRV0_9BACT|nr:MAG: hypothetical protein UV73_C0005G0028 [Candidatus Gottesmanbacteria bacterium GW2011_GWA2_43_14]
MNKTIIQIPVDKELRDKASTVAEKLGFSSLQETIRVFLAQLAQGNISLTFGEKPVQLSPRAIGRYNKLIEGIESGKEKTYTAVDSKDLLNQLHGSKNPLHKKVSQKLQKKNISG